MNGKSLPQITIAPSSGWSFPKFNELWPYRELFYFLAWRNIKVRYKQTLLGIGWVLLQPLATMLVFSLFLGRLISIPSEGIPYPLFILSGIIPWTYFSNSINFSSTSLVSDANLIKKVYFPRIIIPFSGCFSALLDFFISFAVLLTLIPFFGFLPSIHIFLLPFLTLLLFMTAFGVGIWLAALNALFRDVHHLVPFCVQIWLFVTPVVYPFNLLSERWQTILAINPMVGCVELFRWIVLDVPATGFTVPLSLAVAPVLFVSGILFFKKIEPQLADLV